jgi:putative membrane protein
VVDGISFHGSFIGLLFAGLLLGMFNLVLKPILLILTLPLLVFTFGLFYFVVNGLILYLLSLFIPGLYIEGFLAAILGGLIISIFNLVFYLIVK